MHITSTQPTSAAQKGKRIGTLAGFAGYTMNVLRVEGKDVFKSAAENAVAQGLSPKAGVMVKTGAIALIASGFAVAGRLIGGVIGKSIDKYQANKKLKNMIAESLGKEINNVKKMNVDDLEAELKE